MKAAGFRFLRARCVAEALALKAEHGEDARFIAGGQSLVPALNLRLLEPRALIDIAGLPELTGIRVERGRLVIGALTRHAALTGDPLVAAHAPLLLEALPYVAHAAIRNRGTFGGSIALADPAAEWPACCLALDATMVLTGPHAEGERRVPATEFFRGLYATALGPDDLLLRVEIPCQPAGTRNAALELARRHGDFAIVGVAATASDRELKDARIAFFGVADRPMRFAEVERALAVEGVSAAAEALARQVDPPADLYHSAATKRHLAGVLLRRAVDRLRGAA
ncbi:FAD binding domain-containing protein [Falsiroseomonas oryzae]|uniref:FAD binding domain-containing protein n=1 Tax=Falsiroseomonas oryzae TaxID=2766473 RepID=UPI0022EB7092|nr:xanthine dehydrogenase family protein subunit M [Roseomonas sp. MO-31]